MGKGFFEQGLGVWLKIDFFDGFGGADRNCSGGEEETVVFFCKYRVHAKVVYYVFVEIVEFVEGDGGKELADIVYPF